jgi:hypothetical protein
MQMIQLTSRDDAMLEWLGVVRIAEMDALRYALAATSGVSEPVHLRRAQFWVKRLEDLGLVARGRPTHRDTSIIWPTQRASGKQPLGMLGQTMRHEIAVAAVSARYLMNGYSWSRDRKPAGMFDHEADGVAVKGNIIELVEVELTSKAIARYKNICDSHSSRILHEGVSRVVYPSTADASRMVNKQADRYLFRTERGRLVAFTAFDKAGKWVARDAALWVGAIEPTESALPSQLQGFEMFEGSAR